MSVVRDTAVVSVSEAVDGTVRRRSSARRVLATPVERVKVHPRVMAAAHRASRHDERLLIVSATEVWLVPSRRRS